MFEMTPQTPGGIHCRELHPEMYDGEGCAPQVVVCLSEELLSQAVMMVERCRPTLTINLGGARQHWLEGMLRHEIGALPLDGRTPGAHRVKRVAYRSSPDRSDLGPTPPRGPWLHVLPSISHTFLSISLYNKA